MNTVQEQIDKIRRGECDAFLGIDEYADTMESMQARIEFLEKALQHIGDYKCPPSKCDTELEIYKDLSSVRGRLARAALKEQAL